MTHPIEGLQPNSVLNNKQRCEIFGCSTQGGMRRSLTTNTLVIVSNHVKSIYDDRWDDDVLHYTGMGTKGDQSIDSAQNKTLAQSETNGVLIHLFEVFVDQEYLYRGMVALCNDPYFERQPDERGMARDVCVFPLRLKSDSAPIDREYLSKAFAKKSKKAKRLTDDEVFDRAKNANTRTGCRTTSSKQYNRNPWVDLYVTDSSLEAVLSPIDTVLEWKHNLENYDNNTRAVFETIEAADDAIAEYVTGDENADGILGEDGFVNDTALGIQTIGQTIREFFNPSKGEGTFVKRVQGRNDAIAAVGRVREEGSRVDELNNLTALTPEGAVNAVDNVADALAEDNQQKNPDADLDPDTVIYLASDGTPALTGQDRDTGETVVAINAANTDLADSGELINQLVHEDKHNEGGAEGVAGAAGNAAQSEWNYRNDEENRVTNIGSTTTEWLTENAGNKILSEGNKTVGNLNAGNVEFYNEAGHYYTTYYAALRTGIDPQTARTLATYSQLPDEITDLDAISVAVRSVTAMLVTAATDPRENFEESQASFETMQEAKKEMERVQRNLHGLTGGNAEITTKIISGLVQQADSPEEKGILLHLLADTFAHRTLEDEGKLYKTGPGHFSDGTDPDLIHTRPELYAEYVDVLIKVISPETPMSEYDAIKSELLGAVDTAVGNSINTKFKGMASRNNGTVNDTRASDNTTQEIGDKVRELAEQTGAIVDRPEEHNLTHIPSNNPQQDTANYQQHAGGEVNADQVIDASNAVIERVQEGLKNLPKNNREKK